MRRSPSGPLRRRPRSSAANAEVQRDDGRFAAAGEDPWSRLRARRRPPPHAIRGRRAPAGGANSQSSTASSAVIAPVIAARFSPTRQKLKPWAVEAPDALVETRPVDRLVREESARQHRGRMGGGRLPRPWAAVRRARPRASAQLVHANEDRRLERGKPLGAAAGSVAGQRRGRQNEGGEHRRDDEKTDYAQVASTSRPGGPPRSRDGGVTRPWRACPGRRRPAVASRSRPAPAAPAFVRDSGRLLAWALAFVGFAVVADGCAGLGLGFGVVA